MKTKLITALRTCANALENGTFAYEWRKPESCNCGVVACALMGKSVAEMKDMLLPMKRQVDTVTWGSLVGRFCPVTGTPENEVFRALIEAGMSQTDIVELEMLANKEVLKRIDLLDVTVEIPETVTRSVLGIPCGTAKRMVRRPVGHWIGKGNAIAYMRAWADLLTEQGAEDVAVPEPQEAKVT